MKIDWTPELDDRILTHEKGLEHLARSLGIGLTTLAKRAKMLGRKPAKRGREKDKAILAQVYKAPRGPIKLDSNLPVVQPKDHKYTYVAFPEDPRFKPDPGHPAPFMDEWKRLRGERV
jgi:hypothetical protein